VKRSTRGWVTPVERQALAALVHDFRFWHETDLQRCPT
jgi:hypothetical protein